MGNNKKDIDENLENFSYEYVKFINPETKKTGNKIVWISLIVILLSLKIITLTEIGTIGLKVEINTDFLIPILISINIYFFIQFYYLIKIDKLEFKIPSQVLDIITLTNSEFENIERSIESINSEYENLLLEKKELIENRTSKDSDKLELLDSKITNLKKKLNQLNSKLDATKQIVEQSKIKMKKGGDFLKFNKRLNDTFPKIIFYLSIIIYIVSIVPFKFINLN